MRTINRKHILPTTRAFPNGKLPTGRSWLEKVNEWFNSTRNLILTLALVVLVVLFATIIRRESEGKSLILIESLTVKDPLVAKQIDAEILTSILRDTITSIRASFQTYESPNALQKDEDAAFEDYKVKLDLGATGVSVDNSLQLIRGLLGSTPIRVDGECYKIGKRNYLKVRARGRLNFTIKKEFDDIGDIDSILGAVAVDLLGQIEPPMIAVYLTDKSPSRIDGRIKTKADSVKFLRDSIKINRLISSMLENQSHDDDIDGFFSRAYFLHANGYYEQAILNSTTAFKFDRKRQFSSILINWGHSLFKLKEYEDAKKKYFEALKIDPKQPAAYFGIAKCEDSLSNRITAIRYYKRVIELDPTNKFAYFSLGAANYDSQRYSDAKIAYETFTALDPGDASAYYNLALTLNHLDSLDEAKTAFIRAISLNNYTVVYYINYGLCLSYQKEYSKAQQMYRKALSMCLNPKKCSYVDKCYAYVCYANLLSRKTDFKEANKMYQEALKDTSKSASNTLLYAYSKFNEGEYSELKNPSAATKSFQEAISLFNKVKNLRLREGKNNGEPEYGLAISYKKIGQAKLAKEYFLNSLTEFEKLKPESNYDKAEVLYFQGLI